ncbi:MAG: TetR/AcrR family transcriptional regulator [Pseudomonadota bacterium]
MGSRTVGRPREFDEQRVLDSAMDAFWRKGYEATSLSDLCACTGLNKGSLYQSFGDKHSLFMRALEHYADTELRQIAAVAFEQDSPIENICAVMHSVVNHTSKDAGCMMINSLVELAPHDADVLAFLQRLRDQRMRMMTDLVDKAQRAQEITASEPAEDIAVRLMVTLAGLATAVKGFMDVEQAHRVVDGAVAALR